MPPPLEVSDAAVEEVHRLVQAEFEKAMCTAVDLAERVDCATLYQLFSFRRVLILTFCIRKYVLYF